MVGARLAPRQRSRRRALRRAARSGLRVRDRGGGRPAAGGRVVRRRGGSALQHAHVRQQGADRTARRRGRAGADRRRRRVGRRRDAQRRRRSGRRARRARLDLPAGRIRRGPHRPEHRCGARRSAGGDRQCAGCATAARGRAPRPRRSLRDDAAGAAPRRAGRRRAADRRRPGLGRIADRHHLADAGRAQRADHDPVKRAAVDRRPGPATPPRSTAGCGGWRPRPPSSSPDRGWRSRSGLPRSRTEPRSPRRCAPGWRARDGGCWVRTCRRSCASPATTPACWPRRCRQRWCWSATPPASAIRRRRPSTCETPPWRRGSWPPRCRRG